MLALGSHLAALQLGLTKLSILEELILSCKLLLLCLILISFLQSLLDCWVNLNWSTDSISNWLILFYLVEDEFEDSNARCWLI